MQHFDHTFKGELHTTSGPMFINAFEECKFAKRPVTILCTGTGIEIIEEVGITSKKSVVFPYADVSISDDYTPDYHLIHPFRSSHSPGITLTLK